MVKHLLDSFVLGIQEERNVCTVKERLAEKTAAHLLKERENRIVGNRHVDKIRIRRHEGPPAWPQLLLRGNQDG